MHEMVRHAADGLQVDSLARLTTAAMDRCCGDGRMSAAHLGVLATHGAFGPPDGDGRFEQLGRLLWDEAIIILENELNRCGILPLKLFDCRLSSPLQGEPETPFADAANAWFWTLDCLDARTSGARDRASLRLGRPCEPDDVVRALDRLNIPKVHARTVVAWGNRRMEPPVGTEARRLWDEVMDRLAVALRAKGIVLALAPTAEELMDMPLAVGGALAPVAN
jgi:hypothetical protein